MANQYYEFNGKKFKLVFDWPLGKGRFIFDEDFTDAERNFVVGLVSQRIEEMLDKKNTEFAHEIVHKKPNNQPVGLLTKKRART